MLYLAIIIAGSIILGLILGVTFDIAAGTRKSPITWLSQRDT